MSHRRSVLPALVAGAVLAAPAAAQADTVVVDAPGARNVAYGGGYTAWSVPFEGRWRLVARAPDGSIGPLALKTFGAPPRLSIGTDSERRLQLVYARCLGTSTTEGCDVYSHALQGQGEERVPSLATAKYSETAVALSNGQWTFVRRGNVAARLKGVFHFNGRTDRLTRISPTVARETATNGTRVGFTYASSRGGGISVRRLSGEGAPLTPAVRQSEVPRSLQLTRYQAAWLVGDTVFSTTRFAGSGGPYEPETVRGRQVTNIDSLGVGASTTSVRFLDDAGIKVPSPTLFAPE